MRAQPKQAARTTTTTTEEVFRQLFPKRVVEAVKQVAAESGAGTGSALTQNTQSTQSPDLAALVSRFNSEDKCRAYLERLRWPDGVRCPRCEASKGISRIEKRGQFDCDACGYQFSVRAGTIFRGSQLPLWKWFLAVYVVGESKKHVSANRLRQVLGVSYKTAWYLCHRIRAAMKDDAPELLRGIVGAEPFAHDP